MDIEILEEVELNRLDKGNIHNRFKNAMLAVARNIADNDTAADFKREIIIKVVIAPDKEDRKIASMSTLVTTKLAPPEAGFDIVHCEADRETGEIVLKTRPETQLNLFDRG